MQTRKPNRIIVITMHDSGRQFGFCGAPGAFTPNIDRMAGEGAAFLNHYSVASVCMPSRLGILTGKVVHHTHLSRCDPGEATLPKLLGAAGYHTILCGGSEHSSYLRDPRFGYQGDDIGRDIVGYAEQWTERSDGAWVAGKVCEFLQSPAAGEPFFLCANLHEAHSPYDMSVVTLAEAEAAVFPPKLPGLPDTPGTRKRFAAFNKQLALGDRAVGQILDGIRASGRLDDTLVLFTVDHGTDVPRAKQTLYDSGVQTPLILWGPAWLGTAKIEALSSHCDILPTVCEIAGIDIPQGIDGVSLLPAVENGSEVRDAVFFEKGWDNPNEPMRGMRTERYKYIRNFRPGWPIPAVHSFIEVCGKEAYLRAYAGSVRPPEELYDVQGDPAELNNLAGLTEYAQVLAEFRQRVEDMMRRNADELLAEDSVYTRNREHPAVRYWFKNAATGAWDLDLEQPFIVNP